MLESGLNSNKLRREYWETTLRQKTAEEISCALSAIHPTSAQVLIWRYREGKSFTAIKELLGKSISTIRNHHSRGMFDLQQYFVKNEKKG